MKITQLNNKNLFEGLQPGEYYVWKVNFQDGTSQSVKIKWDETSQSALEKHFKKPIASIDHDFGIHGGRDQFEPNQSKEYHDQQDSQEQNQTKQPAFTKPRFNEGEMGGINRSAPATDVSYEKMLDEIMQQDTDQLNELSPSTELSYASKANKYRTDATEKYNKTGKIAPKEMDKIDKRAERTMKVQSKHAPADATYEGALLANLSAILDEATPNAFTNILNKQHANKEVAKPKPSTIDIPYHNWTIRYKAGATPKDPVQWLVMDKKGDIKHRSTATTDKDAVADAEEWINNGGNTGARAEASKNVNIDFNVDFAKQFAAGGETFYATIDAENGKPTLIVSTTPQKGLKTSHIRTVKTQSGSTPLPIISLSPAESNKAGLQPNGRYVLGDQNKINDDVSMFPLIFHGIAQSKEDKMRMGKPGLIVAHSRD